MPRYKLLLVIVLVFLLFFFLISSASKTSFINNFFVHQEQPVFLPGWITRTHRLSGPYNFVFIPLDLSDLDGPVEVEGEPDTAAPAEKPYVDPRGSPYPPGTLADMIWQQKQQDLRFSN
jgi:hypothetical protein